MIEIDDGTVIYEPIEGFPAKAIASAMNELAAEGVPEEWDWKKVSCRLQRAEWLKGMQIGDAVTVRDFWEEEYKTSVSQTTDRFIWLRFATKEVVRFSRKTGRQARGGMEIQMPDNFNATA
ncbi:MAG TPA: hypothetical protein VH601_24100 [Bryobacteraceae bacterium]